MAGKSERVKVEVKESTAGEVRTFNITLAALATDFLLTDLLRQRGVIQGLDGELKKAVKAATESYLSAAEGLIAGLTTETKLPQKSRTNGKRNDRNSTDVRASLTPESNQQGSGAA